MPIGSNWLGDDHPVPASLRGEGRGSHFQVTAQEAAERGWYYRRVRDAQSVEPDTRRCRHCGRILFEAAILTEAERKIRNPISTRVLLGEGF